MESHATQLWYRKFFVLGEYVRGQTCVIKGATPDCRRNFRWLLKDVYHIPCQTCLLHLSLETTACLVVPSISRIKLKLLGSCLPCSFTRGCAGTPFLGHRASSLDTTQYWPCLICTYPDLWLLWQCSRNPNTICPDIIWIWFILIHHVGMQPAPRVEFSPGDTADTAPI